MFSGQQLSFSIELYLFFLNQEDTNPRLTQQFLLSMYPKEIGEFL